jgi:hypothetical protein
MFTKTAPILPAINILATKLFYTDKLNFESAYISNYLVLTKENISIYFFEHKDKRTFLPSACLLFVSNIQDTYTKYSSLGMVTPNGGLIEKPGCMQEFFITDNNGNKLIFTEKKE